MKLRDFYRVNPAEWLFLDNTDVINAKRRALADPNADENSIEEYIRQWVLSELIATYGYPKEWIGERIVIEESVRMGSSYKQADISIKNAAKKTFLYIETKNASSNNLGFEGAREQLESYLAATHTATIGMVTNGKRTQSLEKKIDPNDFNLIPDIPDYDVKRVKYKSVLVKELDAELGKAGKKTGLKPLNSKLENILFECHSLIRDIDGLHDDEALDELSKIIFTKIFDEREISRQSEGSQFKFQIYGAGNVEEVASNVRDLYTQARAYDLNSNSQKIIGYERSRGVFKNQIRLSSNALYKCVEKLQEYSFIDTESTDVKGRAFQKVLGAAIRAGMGQYFTPDEVVDLIVKIINPTPSDLILDPFCGSGHFLSKCLEFVDEQNGNSLDAYSKFDFRFNRLHGIEKSDRMVRIAMTDMMLHDDGHTNIRNTDAFLSFDNYPDIVSLGGDDNDSPEVFSKVLTNPPFGSIMQGEIGEILGRFQIGQNRKSLPLEYIAIERSLQFLKPGGILGIVLPDGIVTNSNAQFARTWIMSRAKVLAAISLPIETFAPFGTQTKTSILILKKYSADEKVDFSYKVFMGNITDIGYDATGRPTNGSTVENLITAWRKFILNPDERPEVDPSLAYITDAEKIQFRWDFKAGSITATEGYVPISNYLDVVNVAANLEKRPTSVFPYLSISELPSDPFIVREEEIAQLPGQRLQGPKHTAKGGDVLFARLGPSMNNKKSLIVDDNVQSLYCSNEFHVLRPKTGISAAYILYLIKSSIFIAQAVSKARGATPSRLRLHKNDLPKILVPEHSEEQRTKLGEEYLAGRIRAQELVNEAAIVYAEVSPDF